MLTFIPREVRKSRVLSYDLTNKRIHSLKLNDTGRCSTSTIVISTKAPLKKIIMEINTKSWQKNRPHRRLVMTLGLFSLAQVRLKTTIKDLMLR